MTGLKEGKKIGLFPILKSHIACRVSIRRAPVHTCIRLCQACGLRAVWIDRSHCLDRTQVHAHNPYTHLISTNNGILMLGQRL